MKSIPIFALLLLVIAFPAMAQEDDYYQQEALRQLNPPPMVYGGLDGSETGIVGALPGTVDVSALGGAVYSIPIQVPKGIFGMQPDLSIVYNSQSGNGLLGWGWNIGGVSAITRVGSSVYYDGFVSGVNFSESDRFALDGQRLVVLDNAAYGSNGAEYKTDLDGMSRIVSYKTNGYNGPTWFKVWTADGLILEYGGTANSRLQFANGNNTEVGMWMLNKVTDRNGNYMTYSYNNDGESISLATVYYSMREQVLGCYSVNFAYGTRDDVELSFIGNQPIKQKGLLEQISVKWWNLEMWRYDFSYLSGGGVGTLEFYNRLESISFTCGTMHYNPTYITWGDHPTVSHPNGWPAYGESDFHDYTTRVHLNNSPNGTGALTDDMKFPGDFNGDGLTDFISVDYTPESRNRMTIEGSEKSDPSIAVIKVYVNKGNTKTDSSNGIIDFDSVYTVGMTIHEMDITMPLGVELNTIFDLVWVYVCDFNGDGLDDFILHRKVGSIVYLHAFKAVLQQNGSVSFTKIPFGEEYDNPFVYGDPNFDEAFVLVGDFLGSSQQDVILAIEAPGLFNNQSIFFYFSFVDNNLGGYFSIGASAEGMTGNKFVTGDFNGDGKTEIWYALNATGNDGKIVGINKNNSNNTYYWTAIKENFLNSSHTIFTGDFNGDGKTDLLSYNPNSGAWEVRLFKTTDCHSTVYDVSASLRLGDPSFYQNSIPSQLTQMDYFLQVADFNGDGKSDVAFTKDGKLQIKTAPVYYDAVLGGTFVNAESYDLDIVGLATNQVLQYSALVVGDFLGQGSASMFANHWLYSKAPMATYYSVASIRDAMVNQSQFEYGYLVHNPMKDDNIFTLSDEGQNVGLSVLTRPLPVRAVKTITSENRLSVAPSSSQSFLYENVLVHKFGRGILGFAETSITSRIADSLQSRTERRFTTTAMGSHPFAALQNEKSYGPMGTLVSETSCTYLEYQCTGSQGNKVFQPVPNTKTTDSYDPISGAFFGRTIEKTTYTTELKDASSYNYVHTVVPYTVTMGTDPSQSVTSASLCEFQTVKVIEYEKPDYDNWVVGRPRYVHVTQKHLNSGCPDVETLTVYEHECDNPFLISKSTDYPGADQSNTGGLATCVLYEYDTVGNVTATTLRALDGSVSDRRTEYEYSYDTLTVLERNALGYESLTDNNYYWELHSAIDCNGLVTLYWCNDHLGLTDWVMRPDGTYGCTAVRWAFDETGEPVAHAPEDAAYYTWERSTGEPPVMTFRDASGLVLRTVTEDIDGNVIYHDTEYDGLGRVWKEYDPYYSNSTTQNYVEYSYDACHRRDTTRFADNTYETRAYSSSLGTSLATTVFHATNNETRTSTKRSNVVGWTMQSTDDSGASVYYSYYADGKLKTAGLNPDIEIFVQYDDAGNRTDITDPNYGHQRSVFNAFGELTSSTTPKGDVIEYRTDLLGRIVKRYDRDNTNNTVDSTLWVYGSLAGEKGLLKSVTFNNGVQALAYAYDTLSRVTVVSDARSGQRSYQTTYGYDANGRVSRISYPTGFVVKRLYDNGRLRYIMDAQDNILWHTVSENAFGQIVSYRTGNGVNDTLTYYANTHLLHGQSAKKGTSIVREFTYDYDDFRNLAAREKKMLPSMTVTESFRYDNLDRLDTVKLDHRTLSVMNYDQYGRMLRRTSEGSEVFFDASYNNQSKPHAVRGADVNTDFFPETSRTIAYTMHDKVKQILQGSDVLTIEYGYDRQRIAMTQLLDGQQTTISKVYVGNCEFINGPDRLRNLTYLSGPLGLFAVYEQVGPVFKEGDHGAFSSAGNDSLSDSGFTNALFYLHLDRLGSITAITNESGTVVQELSYDAWGNLRNPTTWSGSFTGTPKFDRGFTGHEHLYAFGLINMNGRMYDPVMCCFLSVDSYVQDPESPQNFNRYAYCLNNPLRYVDPSGEFLTWSINQYGFSIGVNFTPAGVPLGFGINVSWANGGSVGCYVEGAYRVGAWGAGVQVGYDYNLASGNGAWSVSGFASVSDGCFSVGGSVGINLTEKTSFWNVNAGPSFLCNKSNTCYGGGFSIGYGSGGWNWGVNGFYNRMQKPRTTVLSTVTVEGSDGLLPIGQDDDHGCLQAVYQWIAETYGMELTAETKMRIAECIVVKSDGIYFGESGNKFMLVIESGHDHYYQASDGSNYPTDVMGTIYEEIEKGNRVLVNLAPMEESINGRDYSVNDGHSIGIQSVSIIQQTNIWGNVTSGYSVRVMDPAMNGYYGGYRFISPYYIQTSQNMSIFYRIR